MHVLFETTLKAIYSFLFERDEKISSGPQIRDSYDIKRMMLLVVYALMPCTFMAIINTGVQSFVLTSFDPDLFLTYAQASTSVLSYIQFILSHLSSILISGLSIFCPNLLLVYTTGGCIEILFAAIHKKSLSEGFLVTGLLIVLILPPTLPYWMIITGTAFGLILGKELFGGTGMNLLNPALVCRCLLFFSFPAYMSGEVWVGTNSFRARQSIAEIAKQTQSSFVTGQSLLAIANPPEVIKKIHTEAIRIHRGHPSKHKDTLSKLLVQYNPNLDLEHLSHRELLEFITSPNGLMLDKEYYHQAYTFALLQSGEGNWSDENLFFGNQIGSMGETSTFCCLLGAVFLLITGVASYRVMAAVLLGSYCTALCFEYGSNLLQHSGLLAPAHYSFPAYKQLLLGGLAFGLVFMATDPVSSPTMPAAQWVYGIVIGCLTLIIRQINPAFPEAVMLSILFGNVFSPLFDHIALTVYTKKIQRKRRRLIHE